MGASSPLKVAVSLGLGGASVVCGLPALAPIWSPSRWLLGIADRLTDPTKVALTFDDGPHATFFLVGDQVARRPELAAEIVRQGHSVGLHGYEHHTLGRMSNRQLHEDLRRAVYAVASATQTEPVLYRPPRGVFTYQGLAAVREHGWEPVLWTADGRDWRKTATPRSISQRVTARLEGGEIVLLHDSDYYAAAGSWQNTLDSLPQILHELEERGLQPVPIASAQMLRQSPSIVGRHALRA
jgi:peptidoglycan/xylan/chitin deacetylase (PgdA/CDA1 family)